MTIEEAIHDILNLTSSVDSECVRWCDGGICGTESELTEEAILILKKLPYKEVMKLAGHYAAKV